MIILSSITLPFLITPFIPKMRSRHWTIQLFDYLRFQLTFCYAVLLSCWTVFYYEQPVAWIFIAALLFSTYYQLRYIAPYFRFAVKNVLDTDHPKGTVTLKVVVANVLQPNEEKAAFAECVKKYDPHIFLTLESNADWEQALDELLSTYPHKVAVPLENLYGMHLYSKLEVKNPEIIYRVEEGVPSIEAELKLEGIRPKLKLFIVHPKPPAPGENDSAKAKDVELALLARSIKNSEDAILVAGDFNDVPWSKAIKNFRTEARLNDPRIGRGTYSTFHADYPFVRFPLDHIFCSTEIGINEMERFKIKGSDHFGMFYSLSFPLSE